MRKITSGVSNGYIPPRVAIMSFICEAGFAVSNDNLTEENWGWDD